MSDRCIYPLLPGSDGPIISDYNADINRYIPFVAEYERHIERYMKRGV